MPTEMLEGPYSFGPIPGLGVEGWFPPEGFLAALDTRPVDQQGPDGSPDSVVIEWDTGTPRPPGFVPTNANLVQARFTAQADPDGISGPRPVLPDRNGRLRLSVGSLPIFDRRLLPGRDLATVKALRGVYASRRAVDVTNARKWLGFQLLKLRWSRVQIKQIQPPQYRDEEPIDPDTVLSDNFDGANGPLGQQLTWNNDSGWSNDTNQALKSGGGSTGSGRTARITDTLSGDDVETEVVVAAYNGSGGNSQAAAANRISTDRETSYFGMVTAAGDIFLAKYVNNGWTTLSTGIGSVSISSPDTLRLVSDGNSHEEFWNDASIATATDTSIPSGFSGMHGLGQSGGQTRFDDFTTRDLGAAARASIEPILRMMQGA